MHRYKILVSYCGEGFSGWQRQKNVPSVQQFLEDTLTKVLKESVTLFVAGRTDAGVHATGQVAHFDCPYEITSFHKIIESFNYFGREKGVSIISIEQESQDFHARFSAKERHYQYIILNRPAFCPFWHKRAWHLRSSLCLKSMQSGAEHLIGTHDFTSFRDSDCQSKSPVKTLHHFAFTKTEDHLIIATLKAPSFLHHQVRIMMGTLVEIGQKKRDPSSITSIIEEKSRSKAGITAPPYGLYLTRVIYDENL